MKYRIVLSHHHYYNSAVFVDNNPINLHVIIITWYFINSMSSPILMWSGDSWYSCTRHPQVFIALHKVDLESAPDVVTQTAEVSQLISFRE